MTRKEEMRREIAFERSEIEFRLWWLEREVSRYRAMLADVEERGR